MKPKNKIIHFNIMVSDFSLKGQQKGHVIHRAVMDLAAD